MACMKRTEQILCMYTDGVAGNIVKYNVSENEYSKLNRFRALHSTNIPYPPFGHPLPKPSTNWPIPLGLIHSALFLPVTTLSQSLHPLPYSPTPAALQGSSTVFILTSHSCEDPSYNLKPDRDTRPA